MINSIKEYIKSKKGICKIEGKKNKKGLEITRVLFFPLI